VSELAFLKEKIELFRKMDNLAKAGILNMGMARFFRYARVKGNTLVFVFECDSKFDFRYAKSMILANLRKAYGADVAGFKKDGIVFSDIACVTIKEEPKLKAKEYPKIEDRSSGEFENRCRDEGLRARIEKIRSIIKEWKNS
jgi:N-acyl-D-aspartate/D-glutamate deacylase